MVVQSGQSHFQLWVNPPKSLPAWIRTKRGGLDESQAELGKAIGVSQRCVSRWETGEVPVSRSHLISLLSHFQVPRSEWATILELPAGHAS